MVFKTIPRWFILGLEATANVKLEGSPDIIYYLIFMTTCNIIKYVRITIIFETLFFRQESNRETRELVLG